MVKSSRLRRSSGFRSRILRRLQKTPDNKNATTEALTQLFVRVVALESVLVESKAVDPAKLAQATVKAIIKLQEFNKKQEQNEENQSGI